MKPPNPRVRALDLAIPVASCAAAGIGTGHLTDGLSRDDLLALVAVLAAAVNPVALRDLVHGPQARNRAEVLRAAHAQAEAYRKAGIPLPADLVPLQREYWRDRKATRREAAAREAEDLAAAAAEQEAGSCWPSLASYRRHKARGEDAEGCGCGEAARAVWRERKRDAAREAGPRPEAVEHQQRGEAA